MKYCPGIRKHAGDAPDAPDAPVPAQQTVGTRTFEEGEKA